MKSKIKAGIIIFPGTNCDFDLFKALRYLNFNIDYIWANDNKDLTNYDIVFLPGGFSYGDYLHAGRLAKFSPILSDVKNFINKKSGFTVGICNGFQILCEAKLLLGALTDNLSNKFICNNQKLILNLNNNKIKRITLPIAHSQGRFFCSSDTLKFIKDNNMDFLKYENNPNGSIIDIAGLYDKKNRVIGLMPHPERAVNSYSGLNDGVLFFNHLISELL